MLNIGISIYLWYKTEQMNMDCRLIANTPTLAAILESVYSMKLLKAKLTRIDNEGEFEIMRSTLNTVLISMKIRLKVDNLVKFVKITQKGEKQFNRQTKKFIQRYSTNAEDVEKYKPEFYLYLNAIEYVIYELNRMVEVHHHEFLAHINEDIQIDLSKSPNFDYCKRTFKQSGIDISEISGYESIVELRKICNDLKHAYIQEYSLSKTLKLKTFREFNRKILVDKVNVYILETPNYIEALAKTINSKYPKIEIKKNKNGS
ncbi:hypothetical protein [Niabella ginsengisoli]|uniref:Uncharacterized protein n=1 Tax=Niabella ginsengisoli TaxID=522298 RepID=A0ABS9SK06_9BACT|nr:hypothetical protein [Niabella ginsengisoli]MCH5598645.1 hypothetical protein [Niabella ginsengisoli]